MTMLETDICVIGGGSGGLSVAAGASQMGARVVLFEGHKMGGDCLNYGCVPSKALLAAAKLAYHDPRMAAMGITAKKTVNMAEVKAHIEDVIAGIAPMIRWNGSAVWESKSLKQTQALPVIAP